MKIAHLQHHPIHGWSGPLPSALDGPQTLVLAFGDRQLDQAPQPLRDLRAAFPAAVLLGCSGAGEIAAAQVGDGGLSVVVARFENTALQRASVRLAHPDESHEAGVRLAAQLPAAGLRAVFVLSSGVDVNGAALARGITSALPAGVSVSGGLAGDGSRFQSTWVLEEGECRAACVTAVGLYGDALRVGHGCCGGWQEFGPERVITRAQGSQLFELDGQPALALYKHYLGDLASELPVSALLYPLSVRTPLGGAPALVRTILGLDEAAQSMTFAGDMPVGAIARLMRTSLDRLVASAETAAGQSLAGLGGAASPFSGPLLAVSVSCVGRRLVLGERIEEELEAVVDRLPEGAVHAGFYSYGEISPTEAASAPELHNQTMTLTVFAEV